VTRRAFATLAALAASLSATGGAATSATRAATPNPVLAAAGDIACDPSSGSYNGGRGTPGACRQLATSNLLLRGRYAAVLDLGDNQYDDGAYANYVASYGKSWGRLKRITKPAPGNHEYEAGSASGYFRYFGKAAGPSGRGYYSFDLGGWHIVSLNSNCSDIGGCERGSTEERWLRSDLAAHRTRCTIAYWHHPRFSSGLHGDQDQVAGLWSALYEAGADVVLSGHDHDYERFAPLDVAGAVDRAKGIREFVVGTGGRSHYPILAAEHGSRAHDSTSFGILSLTLKQNGYDWRFVPAVGTFADRGSGRCH
jgi:hypothetical protein